MLSANIRSLVACTHLLAVRGAGWAACWSSSSWGEGAGRRACARGRWWFGAGSDRGQRGYAGDPGLPEEGARGLSSLVVCTGPEPGLCR